jgi:ABC-type taurine transport system ATPase subunit
VPGFIVAQLRGRARRALALLAGIVAATTGFVVLSGSATIGIARALIGGPMLLLADELRLRDGRLVDDSAPAE